ncbi:MAG: DsbA family protein [Candidatus Doudnabacteria bacterium]|nr:DsbA family protein [Candidatus Doudnabacteria bacterium]
MTEHEHHPGEHRHVHDESCEHYFTPAKTIALSVIIGAILICGTMLYNTRQYINTIAIPGGPQQLLNNALQGASQNQGSQQQAQQPSGPVNVNQRASAPVLGNKNAKVTVEEFSDFQCPYCKQFFSDTFAQIKSKYIDTGKIKFVFRNFPLPIHANAQGAAVAAECANNQGKFWEYHDLLFKNGQADGTNLALADLKKYADQMGLNNGTFGFGKNKFNQCLDSNATLSIVQGDLKDGQTAGVSGTPTFYVNGVQMVGAQPYANFEAAIEKALAQ